MSRQNTTENTDTEKEILIFKAVSKVTYLLTEQYRRQNMSTYMKDKCIYINSHQ